MMQWSVRQSMRLAVPSVTLGLLVAACSAAANPETLGCIGADYNTSVDCAIAHDWEQVGTAVPGFDLPSYTPYSTSPAFWLVIYGEVCTGVAVAAISVEQTIPDGLAVVGIAVDIPTIDEWSEGDRSATCGAGMESAQDADAEIRPPTVAPIQGTGSLLRGTWERVGS